MRRSLSFFSSTVCVLLALCAGGLALRVLSDNIARMPILRAAVSLETKQRVGDRSLLPRAAQLALETSNGRCRSSSDQAATTVALADLLSRDQASDYDAWLRSAGETRLLLRHQLGCAPGDGVAWIRLAIVERLVSVSPDRLSTLVAISARDAPADPVAIASRIALWRSLPTETLPRLETVRRNDLRAILDHAWPPEAALLLRSPGPALTAEIDQLLAALPEVRQTHLRAAGLLKPSLRSVPSRGTIGETLIQFMSQPRREDLPGAASDQGG